MINLKKPLSIFTILLALALSAGCGSSGDDNDDKNKGEEIDTTVYSYLTDDLSPGLFGVLEPELTMNLWFLNVTWPSTTYDAWSQNYKSFLYKDEQLEMPYTGSDIIDKNTIIFSVGSFNGQGAVIGEMSGSITLTDIPHPDTQVHICNRMWNMETRTWWDFSRRINMDSIDPSGDVTLDWTLPVYASFIPNLQSSFTLVVVPGDSMKSYNVSVPTRKIISSAVENVGSLGTVSIKGVKLSGTLNVIYKGEPVPYVEISADYPVSGMLNTTCLNLPGPGAPWSMTINIDKSNERDIVFYIRGFEKKNGTMLFDRMIMDLNIIIDLTNQDVENIDLVLGEIYTAD